MANKVQGYGFSKEIQNRIDAKYAAKDEREVSEWFDSLGLGCPCEGRDHMQEFLESGERLCQLANIIQPNAIKKIHDIAKCNLAGMKGMKMQENISFFIRWAKSFGLTETDSFQTVYLYEGKDMGQVLATLRKVGGLAKSKGCSVGKCIGVAESKQNKRNFSAEKLNAGKHMTTNQTSGSSGAIAAKDTGINYGLGRQVTDKTSTEYCADTSIVGQQYGGCLNSGKADNAGFGTGRQVADQTSQNYNADYSTPGAQMGGASNCDDQGTAPGTSRQIHQ